MTEFLGEQLDPRYVTMLRQTGVIRALVVAAILAAALAAVAKWGDVPLDTRAPFVVSWAVLVVAYTWWSLARPSLLYRHSSFVVDGEQIEIRRGIFVRRIVNVPRSRVQHTDVSQGPFERRHGLGTLLIFTAGVSHAVVPLAGLNHARAIAIRDILLPRERTAQS